MSSSLMPKYIILCCVQSNKNWCIFLLLFVYFCSSFSINAYLFGIFKIKTLFFSPYCHGCSYLRTNFFLPRIKILLFLFVFFFHLWFEARFSLFKWPIKYIFTHETHFFCFVSTKEIIYRCANRKIIIYLQVILIFFQSPLFKKNIFNCYFFKNDETFHRINLLQLYSKWRFD